MSTTIAPLDPLAARVRRRWRVWMVVLVLLAVQVGWTMAAKNKGSVMIGWSGRPRLVTNMAAVPPAGYYLTSMYGSWFIAQTGWQAGNPAAAGVPQRVWMRWGVIYTDARNVNLRLLNIDAWWTTAPSALLAIVTGVRWFLACRQLHATDPGHDRGFEIASA